jgi:hypothetical protein
VAQLCEGYGGNPSGSSLLDALCDFKDPPPPRDHVLWERWRRVTLSRYAQYVTTVEPVNLRNEFILAHNVRMGAQGTDRGATAGGPVHLNDTGRYRFDVEATVRPGWIPEATVQPGFESEFGAAQADEGDTDPALGAGAEPQQGAQAPPPTTFRPPPRMPSAFNAVNPEVRPVPTLPPENEKIYCFMFESGYYKEETTIWYACESLPGSGLEHRQVLAGQSYTTGPGMGAGSR